MSNSRMATPNRTRKPATGSSGSSPMGRRTKGKEAKPAFNLKQTLFTTALWGLGIVNVILIVSFVSRHFFSGNEPSLNANTDVPAIPAENFKVEVLNGCGVNGLASKYAVLLKENGFDPVKTENYEGGLTTRTYIIDRLSEKMVNGLKMADALGLSRDYVSYKADAQRMVAVSLILGQDYKTIPANPK
ncbi:MAG: LytR C-terminal domain-containing protein [candidate division KSB1 bacterium]